MAQPPADHPRYLLDVQRWQVRLFTACWNEPGSELRKRGYGAISYAWGKWNDRANAAANLPGYPTFDIERVGPNQDIALDWAFPIVKAIVNNRQERDRQQFTVQDAQTALQSMGRRFVWWDWACIPQNTARRPEIAAALEAIQLAELDKMRVVYPYSTRGIIWAHTVDWDNESPLKTALKACCEYMAAGGTGKTVASVYKVVDALTDVHLAEEWFRSLWCFQEGVLFAHPNRTAAGNSSGSFRDVRGRALDVDTPREQGDLMDLVTVASGIMGTVISMLQSIIETPAGPNAPRPHGPVEAWSLQGWCSDPAFEQPARGLINRLMATGLVFMVAQNPLSLLNARLGRHPSSWSSAMDIEVNTVVGALDLTLNQEQLAAMAQATQQIGAVPANDPQRAALVAGIRATEVDAVREGMLVELFRYYQWRMMLLATLRRPQPVVAPGLTPLWSEIVKVPRHRPVATTPFTALETFLATDNLSERFKPPRLRYANDPPPPQIPVRGPIPDDQFALPELEYRPAQKLLLLKRMLVPARAAVPYRLFQLAQYAQPLWARCMFYDQAPTNGAFIPTFQFVGWAEWAAVFGANVVLVPLEYLHVDQDPQPWKTKTRLRCVVLSNFGDQGYPVLGQQDLNALQRAVFVGVVDIEGDEANPVIALDRANLDLNADVIIY